MISPDHVKRQSVFNRFLVLFYTETSPSVKANQDTQEIKRIIRLLQDVEYEFLPFGGDLMIFLLTRQEKCGRLTLKIVRRFSMQAIRQHVTVQSDGLIQICVPELKPGTVAEVIILDSAEHPPKKRLADTIGKGRGAYATPDEATAFVRKERDAWE
jgi:hypothetical protein